MSRDGGQRRSIGLHVRDRPVDRQERLAERGLRALLEVSGQGLAVSLDAAVGVDGAAAATSGGKKVLGLPAITDSAILSSFFILSTDSRREVLLHDIQLVGVSFHDFHEAGR